MCEAIKELEKNLVKIQDLAKFLGVSEAFLKEKWVEGMVSFSEVGRGKYFGYVPSIINAVRENMLASGAGKENHAKTKRSMEKWNSVDSVRKRRKSLGGKGKSKGQRALQDIREEKSGASMA